MIKINKRIQIAKVGGPLAIKRFREVNYPEIHTVFKEAIREQYQDNNLTMIWSGAEYCFIIIVTNPRYYGLASYDPKYNFLDHYHWICSSSGKLTRTDVDSIKTNSIASKLVNELALQQVLHELNK